MRCFLTLMAQLNALISFTSTDSGVNWKRPVPFLEKHSSALNKPIKLNQPCECSQNYSQMYGFSEQHFDVNNYSSVISSIAFSKCTQFFNNCLIELSLIITKSRAKLKVISSENYC